MLLSHSNEAFLLLCRSVIMRDNIGNLYNPGNMSPFTRGGGIGYGPLPDLMEMGWEGSGSTALLSAPLHGQGEGRGWQNNLMGGKFI